MGSDTATAPNKDTPTAPLSARVSSVQDSSDTTPPPEKASPEAAAAAAGGWATTLQHDIDPSHSDVPILACCFVSGLCDSVAFNASSVFVSMQTGKPHCC